MHTYRSSVLYHRYASACCYSLPVHCTYICLHTVFPQPNYYSTVTQRIYSVKSLSQLGLVIYKHWVPNTLLTTAVVMGSIPGLTSLFILQRFTHLYRVSVYTVTIPQKQYIRLQPSKEHRGIADFPFRLSGGGCLGPVLFLAMSAVGFLAFVSIYARLYEQPQPFAVRPPNTILNEIPVEKFV